MGIRLNEFNSIRSQSQLGQLRRKIVQSSERLATGKRINKAYDDVVGLLKSASLTSSINHIESSQNQNAQTQASLALSDGTLFQNLDQLQNLRDLAVQASDDTVDAPTRQILISQANDHASALGTSAVSLNLTSSNDARSSLAAIDSVIENVVSRLAASGSQQQALESESKVNQSTLENLQTARSDIQDTDFASEFSNNKMLQVQQTLLVRVLRYQNEEKKSVLNLVA